MGDEEASRASQVGAPDAGVVPARLELGERSTTVAPRIVVWADGLRSVCCRDRRLARPLYWLQRLGRVAHREGVGGPADQGAMHVRFGSYCGVAPLGEGCWHVVVVAPLCDGRTMFVATIFDETVAAQPALAARLEHATQDGRIGGIGPMAKRDAPVSRGQVLLTGDATGCLDPFTGEGIHRAIRSARLAAGTILACCDHGDSSSAAPFRDDGARRREVAPKERLCAVVPLFRARPRLLEIALGRVNDRPRTAQTLARVLSELDRPATSRRLRSCCG